MKSFIADKNRKLSKLALIHLVDLSYSALRQALRKKDVKVNGKRTDKDLTLNVGDKVEIYYNPTELKSYSVEFFDENVVVINKKSGFTSEKVYENVCEEFEGALFIHRLDRNTSGLMIFALNKVAENELLLGFKNRTFDKKYLARVKGVPTKKKDVLNAYLFKDEKNALVTVTDKKVKGSVLIKTGYEVISENDEFSDLSVTLYTGKTHQIRAHLAYIGHPILGDGKYGDFSLNNKLKLKRQLLTATELTLRFTESSPLFYLNNKKFTVKSEF
ncbi:MAG: RluA family pseudouridine synthase [Clostridia bacterium]|nr:RluA family pseudouridine synthase [Clostridia bacterium]